LICNALCFQKTENDRFGPNSGGVPTSSGYFEIRHQFFIFEIKKYENSYKYAWQFKAILS
jgi:hypothetical protein